MKEVIFIRQNKEKWINYENKIKHIGNLSTDELSDIYLDTTSDLAYAQCHYPDARITPYLNNMTRTLQDYIYTPKKKDYTKIFTIWRDEIPEIVADAHKEMLLSFCIFTGFTIIGIILAIQSLSNIILNLGPDYVSMTIENIKNGMPTNVYNTQNANPMFLGITYNNVSILLKTYGFGVIPIIGPGYILMNNGIMLGEFQTLFFKYGVGLESMLSIWIHGTLEISSIIISGAASLALGKGWILPGTYSRSESFKRSGLRSIKILLSTIPLVLMAGFLESFITRHTEFPIFVKLAIILGSLAFILFYYVYIPYKIRKSKKEEEKNKKIFLSTIEM